jgi:hypothetical protein
LVSLVSTGAFYWRVFLVSPPAVGLFHLALLSCDFRRIKSEVELGLKHLQAGFLRVAQNNPERENKTLCADVTCIGWWGGGLRSIKHTHKTPLEHSNTVGLANSPH